MKVQPLIKKLIYSLTIALAIVLTMLAPQSVSADIGPKPSLEFEFDYEIDDQPSIIEATLLQCSDQSCVDAKPLEDLGPQGFSCEIRNCSALAYNFRDYARLVIRFSDGVDRMSDVFKI